MIHPSDPRAVQLIVLSAQRVKGIARLPVDQWDLAERIIECSKSKNHLPHVVPVPSIAAELIKSIARLILNFGSRPATTRSAQQGATTLKGTW